METNMKSIAPSTTPPAIAGWTFLALQIAIDQSGTPEIFEEVFVYGHDTTGEIRFIPGPCFELVINDDGEPHRGRRL
jgi:hypothetical protein